MPFAQIIHLLKFVPRAKTDQKRVKAPFQRQPVDGKAALKLPKPSTQVGTGWSAGNEPYLAGGDPATVR